jgi:hypothetical protein
MFGTNSFFITHERGIWHQLKGYVGINEKIRKRCDWYRAKIGRILGTLIRVVGIIWWIKSCFNGDE